MKEYRIIEDQEAEKHPRNRQSQARRVSPCKKREAEKEMADPTKLEAREIPLVLLDKIDRMIRKRIKNVAFKKEQDVIKELSDESGKKEGDSNQENTESIEADEENAQAFEEWVNRKSLEQKLRKQLIHEALKTLDQHREMIRDSKQPENEVKKQQY